MRGWIATLLFFGCASTPRPAELVALDDSLGNEDRAAQLEKLDRESIAHARRYYALAAKAFDDGEDEQLKQYVELAKLSWETAVEREKTEAAERRTEAAVAKQTSMESQKAEQLARKAELDARITRMERILAMQGEEAKSAAEKKRLEAELAKAREEHARLKAESEAKSSALAGEKAKLDVLEERKTLLEEAAKIPAGSAKQETRGVVITLHELFAPGKTQVQLTHEYVVEEIAKLANKYSTYAILVEGFTDSRGRPADNLALSTSRAQSVANRLVSVGKVDLNRIRSAGYGEERPVADNSTSDGRAKNRRIEVVFVFPN
jgi:outer membrane protein OmpA-like peptidoglycan-associated protein